MLDKEKCPAILNDFLNYLAGIRGYSINTISGYRIDLMQFFNFIKKYKEIEFSVNTFNIFVILQIQEADVFAFLVYLNYNRGDGPYTLHRKIAAIKAFYKWLFYSYPSRKEKNPVAGISPICKHERLPKYLKLDQAKQIQEIFTKDNCNFPERNNAIINLFLSSGLRISELVRINYEDVDFNNNSIIISGKNSKERRVYFSNYCKEKILNYLKLRKNLSSKDALFINRFEKRLGVRGVEVVCQKAFALGNIANLGYTTHSLRHTAATIIYKYVKDDVLLLKEFLGHSSIASTQIYTHIDNIKLKEAINNHPLSNYKVK